MTMPEAKITVYGAPWCPDCRRSKQFLGEQRVPFNWVDIDQDEEGRKYTQKVNNGKQIIPTIVFDDGSILVEPTNAELAAKLGISPQAKRSFYDLVVVGAGPAGLTAALYAAREGIETLVIERAGVGGQAGTTERIDNYPGFSQGIGGAELADQMRAQVERFGVEILPAQAVTEIMAQGDYKLVRTEAGDEYCSRALLLATGSRYRRLGVPGEEDFIGAGIHFCATCDGPFYKGQEMVVVGGGNSGVEEGLFPDQVRQQSHGTGGPGAAERKPDTPGEAGRPSEDGGPVTDHGPGVQGKRASGLGGRERPADRRNGGTDAGGRIRLYRTGPKHAVHRGNCRPGPMEVYRHRRYHGDQCQWNFRRGRRACRQHQADLLGRR